MKKLPLLGAMLLWSSILFAQIGDDKKGPEYKNSKPWEGQTPKVASVTTKKQGVKGPAYKNSKPWAATALSEIKITAKRKRLKGPKAKNSNPWD